jgi:hypothetical protein
VHELQVETTLSPTLSGLAGLAAPAGASGYLRHSLGDDTRISGRGGETSLPLMAAKALLLCQVLTRLSRYRPPAAHTTAR